jgi:tetratricopeptide (TPR) repeat protein
MKNKNEDVQKTLPRIDVNKVISLYSDGKFEESISLIKTLNEKYPNEPILFNIIGACYKSLGQLDLAVKMFETAIKIKPSYAEAFFNLGVVLKGLKKNELAIDNFKKAISIKSNYFDAHNNLGNSFKEIGLIHEAIESYEWAIAYKHDFFQAHNNLGLALSQNRQFKLAVNSFEDAIKFSSDFIDAHFNHGLIQSHMGNKDIAIKSFQRVIEINPKHYEAYRNLCSIKTFKVNDPQIPIIESLFKQPNLTKDNLIDLHFAMADVYEDIGNIKKYFKFLNIGNELKKAQLNYNIDVDKSRFSFYKKLFSNHTTKLKIKNDNSDTKSPIFIVGMPRSGTSLVEQIIASHREVYGGGELKTLAESTLPLLNRILENNSNNISKKDLEVIRKNYLNHLSKFKINKRIITDKMPLNFQYIGFILAAIPDAKIIHIKRDAMATCWSNYKHYFSSKGNGFSFNQNDLASYYNLYIDLMEFWNRSFPEKIYEISYEKLTVNQEYEIKGLLKYCNLEWDENCLNFHNNDRVVQTISSSQVRQKMYQGSSEAWKQYKDYLSPLKEDLNS